MNQTISTKTIFFMKKNPKKTDYESPRCEQISISPQAQVLQAVSYNSVTLEAFGIYDDSDPYFE